MQYEYFGVLLDMSRNAVMKVSELKKFIDVLAKLGYNAIELYTEDTYEVPEEPFFGYLRGRYSQNEIREIDLYAKQKGIELIPCIQTLAHFNAPRKNFAMRELFDTADILLCEEDRTYQFIENLIKSVSESYSSRKINIGMDEAHSLGLGRYLSKHGYTDKHQILTKHLKKVLDICAKYGLEPHMWSDMFFRPINNGAYLGKNLHIPKEIIDAIPNGVDLCYWDYYTQDEETYSDMFTAHEETGKNTWFFGGAWSWCGFAPYNRYSLVSMKPAMKQVKAHGIKNVFITLWGDGGAECSYFALLPALYAIKQFAHGNEDMDKIMQGFYELFGIDYDVFTLLDLPNEIGRPDWNGTGWPENPCKALLYTDPFLGLYDVEVANDTHIPYDIYAKTLKENKKYAKEYAYLFDYMYALCDCLAIKAELGIKTRKAYREGKKQVKAIVKDYTTLIKRLEKFISVFRSVWHKENKGHGWEVQDVRLGGLKQRLITCKGRLLDYVNGKIDRIEELDDEVLDTTKTDMVENNYSNVVTRCNL